MKQRRALAVRKRQDERKAPEIQSLIREHLISLRNLHESIQNVLKIRRP
jgi:hypothetical protein